MSTKILVADDSITIQKVIGIIFGGEEYSLTVVDNGKAALDKARETSPDILLIDALMPGMTGYEACEQIRAVPELAGKPILLMTGSFEPFDETRAQSCGANDFIAKPFEAQQIITKVKELIAGSTSTAEATPTSQPAAPTPQPQPSADIFADLVPSASAVSAAPVFVAPAEPAVAMPAFHAAAAPMSNAPPAAPAMPTTFGAPGANDDIWGAFTASAEPSPMVVEPQAAVVPSPEPDVFAIASEVAPLQSMPSAPQQNTAPAAEAWAQVEEQAFAFEAAPVAAPAPYHQLPSVDENTFGEVSFADTFQSEPAPPVAPSPQTGFDVLEAMEPISGFAAQAPVVEIAPLAAIEPAPAEVAEPAAPSPQPAPASVAAPPAFIPAAELSEEQLKAAIAATSKEVIERIVWEVVPDLAEAMIREAIRKIKEGV